LALIFPSVIFSALTHAQVLELLLGAARPLRAFLAGPAPDGAAASCIWPEGDALVIIIEAVRAPIEELRASFALSSA